MVIYSQSAFIECRFREGFEWAQPPKTSYIPDALRCYFVVYVHARACLDEYSRSNRNVSYPWIYKPYSLSRGNFILSKAHLPQLSSQIRNHSSRSPLLRSPWVASSSHRRHFHRVDLSVGTHWQFDPWDVLGVLPVACWDEIARGSKGSNGAPFRGYPSNFAAVVRFVYHPSIALESKFSCVDGKS